MNMRKLFIALLLLVLLVPAHAQQPVTLQTQLDPNNDGIRIYGSDDGGTTKRLVKTDSTGSLQVDIESGNVGVVPITSGGLLISRTVAGASTNSTNIKNAAGQVYAVIVSNVNASPRYIHLHNTSTGPTCSNTPVATFIVPGNTAGAGTNIPMNPGVAFSTGISFCFTADIAGTSNAAANDGVITLLYK